jgi:hypothetical protein
MTTKGALVLGHYVDTAVWAVVCMESNVTVYFKDEFARNYDRVCQLCCRAVSVLAMAMTGANAVNYRLIGTLSWALAAAGFVLAEQAFSRAETRTRHQTPRPVSLSERAT